MLTVELSLIVLRSANPEHSAGFYQALGLSFVKHWNGSGPEHFASQLGPVVLEIYNQRDDQECTSATRLRFRVQSVDIVAALAEESGGKILSHPRDSEWGRRAVVQDPDGHKIELTQD